MRGIATAILMLALVCANIGLDRNDSTYKLNDRIGGILMIISLILIVVGI